jgi:rRNA small subunit pseudouridine methyltransferase Nep1
MRPHTVILEEASLELVPKKFWTHESCRRFQSMFGIPPENQILDDNFHHEIIEKLPGREKRGRPDIVHFALLDVMSTPAYQDKLIQPVVHTINDDVIAIKDGVRLPRTEWRFNGVMSKILRRDLGAAEKNLFEDVKVEATEELFKSLKPADICCLSTQGVLRDLQKYLSTMRTGDVHRTQAWVVGGFARGHFGENVKGLANELISISDRPLAAHVVTARLSYEIERSKML